MVIVCIKKIACANSYHISQYSLTNNITEMQLLKIGNVLFKGLLMGEIFPAFPLDACISNGPGKQLTMILFQFALHPLP